MSRHKKKSIVVDSAGNEVKCYTIRAAAKEIGLDIAALKLALYKQGRLPYYKLMGLAGKRQVIRLTAKDLREFEKEYRQSKDLYDGIADKIYQARKEHPITRFNMSQVELAKECGIDSFSICKIERKKVRVGIKTLEKIAKAFGRDFEWFLSE